MQVSFHTFLPLCPLLSSSNNIVPGFEGRVLSDSEWNAITANIPLSKFVGQMPLVAPISVHLSTVSIVTCYVQY